MKYSIKKMLYFNLYILIKNKYIKIKESLKWYMIYFIIYYLLIHLFNPIYDIYNINIFNK